MSVWTVYEITEDCHDIDHADRRAYADMPAGTPDKVNDLIEAVAADIDNRLCDGQLHLRTSTLHAAGPDTTIWVERRPHGIAFWADVDEDGRNVGGFTDYWIVHHPETDTVRALCEECVVPVVQEAGA